jgi:DNA helicase-2/ATP-dependent DNA helicase PcrA
MPEADFKSTYARLNAKQREAVEEIQGPMMVIAGPGTGKTSILTLRIVTILKKTDTPPDAILALTFTESGAFSIRRKLVELIGAGGYRVNIFTFHGFAHNVIRRFAESFPRIVGSRSATAADQIRILEAIFLKTKFKLIRPFGDVLHYVPKALHAIRDLKRENISPDAFRKALVAEEKQAKKAPDRFHASGRFKGELKALYRDLYRKIEKSQELAEVYAKYEDILKKEQLFDFEDMILEVIRALERDKNLLLSLQEQYHYVLADEHQDANNAQNRILELLSSYDDSPNLFVVGDEKQAIYRFQGASIENFLYFKKLYPKARLVNLVENYRSTQAILDASHSLMEKGALPESVSREILRPRLTGMSAGSSKNIRFLEFSKHSHEIAFVVSDIETRLSAGAKPHDIAVLFRTNEDALPLVDAFERTNVPFLVLADEDILRDEELSKLLLMLRAVCESGNEGLFARMLHLEFLRIPPVSLYAFLRFARERRIAPLQALSHTALRKKVPKKDLLRISTVVADFSKWAHVARNKSAGEAVETIARESGFVAYLLKQRGSLRALEKLDRLFSHLKDLSEHRRSFSLADFLETLDRLSRHGVRLGGTALRPELLDSVTLMTAHRAKGLEFSYVYIVNASDGCWGGRRARSDFYLPIITPHLRSSTSDVEGEDERRLFFVALTRAKKEVLITVARESADGRQSLPSEFVEAIAPELISKEDTIPLEKRLAQVGALYLKPRKNSGPSVTLKDYLQKLFLEQGLTVTALNNYLSCPWEYFFKNLVRLPQLPEPYQSYGTAVHEALHGFFNAHKEWKVGKSELLKRFDAALERSPLPLREFVEFKERGRKALSGYFDARKNSFMKETFNEFEVTGVFVPLDKKVQLLLRGKLDKVELLQDGHVRVIDYKTGAPKSRAHILGETKSSEGNMKRQLDFYKLLLDNFEKGKYRMKSGAIDFVEPDKQGKYHYEAFEVGEKDVATLLEEVKRIGSEIYTLGFWSRRCGDRKCEYCKLRGTLE